MIDPAHWPALHAEALECSRLLQPPLNQVNPRLFAGAVRGTGTGASVEFHDQRPWQIGDDPRRVHWAASARANKPILVQYREEARPALDLILDCSLSMQALPGKAERALALTAWIAAAARDLGAATRLLLVDGPRHQFHPGAAIESGHWLESARLLPQAKQESPDSTSSAATAPTIPELSILPLRPSALRVFISDLLFAADPESILRPLMVRDGRAQIWAPWHPDEAEPRWEGHCLLEEPESHSQRSLEVSPKMRTDYRHNYATHFAAWHNACRRHRLPCHRVTTEQRLGEALRQALTRTGG